MAFLDARLLERVAYGFEGRKTYQTRVHELRSGQESRNADRSNARWTFSALFEMVIPEDYALVVAAFDAVRGSNDSFRFQNPLDYTVTGQSLGVAPSGTTAVQLVKSSGTFGGVTRSKNITKPVAGTVTVYQSGIAKAGTFSTTTGLFTPDTAWTLDAPLTADFDWDVPVRFMADELPATYDNWRAINVPIELIEVLSE